MADISDIATGLFERAGNAFIDVTVAKETRQTPNYVPNGTRPIQPATGTLSADVGRLVPMLVIGAALAFIVYRMAKKA